MSRCCSNLGAAATRIAKNHKSLKLNCILGLYLEKLLENSTMSNVTELDLIGELESFLYTPYGMSTLAVFVMLLTSVLWGVGCCVCYCCYRRRRFGNQEGTLEASREMEYFGMLSDSTNSRSHLGGGGHSTMSSGYNTGPTAAYSLSHTGNNTVTSSLDSIIDN